MNRSIDQPSYLWYRSCVTQSAVSASWCAEGIQHAVLAEAEDERSTGLTYMPTFPGLYITDVISSFRT